MNNHAVDKKTVCAQCKRTFNDAEGDLPPTLDGVLCPHCGGATLFETAAVSEAAIQEALCDERWESRRSLEDDDFTINDNLRGLRRAGCACLRSSQ